MPVLHTCFLEIAKDSLERNGELWTRNAISRAYYGLYHSALRMTDNMTPQFSKDGEKLPGGSHMRFYLACCSGEAASIKNLDVQKVMKIGVKLKMLHAQRVNADYKLDRKINRITALSTLNDVEEANAIIDDLLGDNETPLIA